MATHFTTTYGRAVESVRSICHVVGDLVFSEETIIDLLRGSAGEVFSRCAIAHERYWVHSAEAIAAEEDGSFAAPDDLVRIISLNGVDSDDASRAKFREASVIEVEDETARTPNEDDSNDLVKQNIFCVSNGIIRTSIPLASITIDYVFDPVVHDAAADANAFISCPSHLIMPVYQLTSATILGVTAAERAQFMEGRAMATINKFLEGLVTAEKHSFSRKQSYTQNPQMTAVQIRDY